MPASERVRLETYARRFSMITSSGGHEQLAWGFQTDFHNSRFTFGGLSISRTRRKVRQSPGARDVIRVISSPMRARSPVASNRRSGGASKGPSPSDAPAVAPAPAASDLFAPGFGGGASPFARRSLNGSAASISFAAALSSGGAFGG